MCLSSFSFLPKGPRVVPVWIRGTEYTVYTLYTNTQQHSFPLLSRRHKPTTFFSPQPASAACSLIYRSAPPETKCWRFLRMTGEGGVPSSTHTTTLFLRQPSHSLSPPLLLILHAGLGREKKGIHGSTSVERVSRHRYSERRGRKRRIWVAASSSSLAGIPIPGNSFFLLFPSSS